jgi:hypothetical protein
MLRTVIVFGVIVIALVVFLPGKHHATKTESVDYSTELDIVRHRAPYHVLAPMALSADWTATHVTIKVPQNGSTVTAFDLGFYVKSSDAYAHLLQSNAPGAVRQELGAKARRTGSEQLAGQSYQTWTDQHGQPALVRTTADGSTVVVDGQASDDKLAAVVATLAAALR